MGHSPSGLVHRDHRSSSDDSKDLVGLEIY